MRDLTKNMVVRQLRPVFDDRIFAAGASAHIARVGEQDLERPVAVSSGRLSRHGARLAVGLEANRAQVSSDAKRLILKIEVDGLFPVDEVGSPFALFVSASAATSAACRADLMTEIISTQYTSLGYIVPSILSHVAFGLTGASDPPPPAHG